MYLFIALFWVVSQAYGVDSKTESKEFALKSISELHVENLSGDLKVTAVQTGKASVVAHKNKFDETCVLTMEQKAQALVVTVKQRGLFKESCEVDLEVKVPKSVALDVETGSGDINISGTRGDLSFKNGSGRINVNAEVLKLDGKSGSGNISITGLTGDAKLKSGSGTLALTYIKPPTTGELDIFSGSGSVEVALPKESKVRTSFKAGSGNLKNEFGDSEGAFPISMKSGSGDLRVKKIN